uniref:Uncharacterized protein n=1 Tax=viral metagenome TaxID=1070528 RepID=A0A6C0CQR0_9ZZZZ
MTPLQLQASIASLYLIIDTLYVTQSKSVYEGRIKAIQNSGYPTDKPGTIIIAILSFLAVALAWWILVAERITIQTSYLEAFRLALVLALAIYGVFNGTLYVAFNEWNTAIFIRDLLWGITIITFLTFLYVYSLHHI